MKKFIIMALALCAACVAMADDYCIKIKDFSEIVVADNINVVYKSVPDSAGMAVYSCDPKIASAITFDNEKGKLKVQVISDTPLSNLPTVRVYSYSLVKAANWKDSTLYVEKNNTGTSFSAKVIGNGHIVAHDVYVNKLDASVNAGSGHIFLTGKAQKAKFSIRGSGVIQADQLEAAEVSCSLIGIGTIDCYSIDKLSVSGAGSGTVYYAGKPAIKKHSLGLKVLNAD